MTDLTIEDLITDFKKVAEISGLKIPHDFISYDNHHPPSNADLEGKIAIYLFFFNDACLKVGKATNAPRFTSQHYGFAANSTLAKSLVSSAEKLGINISKDTARQWMLTHLHRYNIYLNENCDIFALNLLEAFLHCKLQPVFEGFINQR